MMKPNGSLFPGMINFATTPKAVVSLRDNHAEALPGRPVCSTNAANTSCPMACDTVTKPPCGAGADPRPRRLPLTVLGELLQQFAETATEQASDSGAAQPCCAESAPRAANVSAIERMRALRRFAGCRLNRRGARYIASRAKMILSHNHVSRNLSRRGSLNVPHRALGGDAP
jgi:hypothetical protein